MTSLFLQKQKTVTNCQKHRQFGTILFQFSLLIVYKIGNQKWLFWKITPPSQKNQDLFTSCDDVSRFYFLQFRDALKLTPKGRGNYLPQFFRGIILIEGCLIYTCFWRLRGIAWEKRQGTKNVCKDIINKYVMHVLANSNLLSWSIK